MKARIAAIAAVVGSCAAPPPPGPASELVGRVAGTPQRCVLIDRSESLRVASEDRHTLLYGRGRTVWANRLGPGCGFNRGDVLVIRPIGSSYCRGDLVRSFDPVSRFPGPSCYLGDFFPYARAG